MYLRGHAVASHVYRIEWQTGRDEEATTAERSMFAAAQTSFLELSYAGLLVRLDATSEPISPGQATKFALPLNDHRVSWMHAMSAWRSGQFVITDASTYGTWLYVGSQSDPWSCAASSAIWPAGHKWCLALAGPTRPHPG